MKNNNITPRDIKQLRELKNTLTNISQVRGAPNRLKIFIAGLIKQIDKILVNEKARNRLSMINSLIELIVKFLTLLQLIK
ncbi:MAG: hypothetical protein IPH11_11795 [Ignavibacteriales bacterium]|nr:hypothetical protein [Ignavibacteriales bacterium]